MLENDKEIKLIRSALIDRVDFYYRGEEFLMKQVLRLQECIKKNGEYLYILPKEKGVEEGLIVKYKNNKKFFFKITEALEAHFNRKKRREEIAIFRLLGEKIAIQPEYDEDKREDGFDVFFSESCGDNSMDFNDYLKSIKSPFKVLDEIPDGLDEILVKSLIFGITDIRGDNIIIVDSKDGNKKEVKIIDFFVENINMSKKILDCIQKILNIKKDNNLEDITIYDFQDKIKLGSLFNKTNNYAENIVDLFILQQSIRNFKKLEEHPYCIVEVDDKLIYDEVLVKTIKEIAKNDQDGTKIKNLFEKTIKDLLKKFNELEYNSLDYILVKNSMSNIIEINEIASNCFGSPLITENTLKEVQENLSIDTKRSIEVEKMQTKTTKTEENQSARKTKVEMVKASKATTVSMNHDL